MKKTPLIAVLSVAATLTFSTTALSSNIFHIKQAGQSNYAVGEQTGETNNTDIIQSGTSNIVNKSIAVGYGNVQDIDQVGNNNVLAVETHGRHNGARVLQGGDPNNPYQTAGNNNTANVVLEGEHNSANINQWGYQHHADIKVKGVRNNVFQDAHNPDQRPGFTYRVDIEGADNYVRAGDENRDGIVARNIFGENEANVVIRGSRNSIQMYQNDTDLRDGNRAKNVANHTVNGDDNSITSDQIGPGHLVNTNVNGTANAIYVRQLWDYNTANIGINGVANGAVIIQEGNGNIANMDVQGDRNYTDVVQIGIASDTEAHNNVANIQQFGIDNGLWVYQKGWNNTADVIMVGQGVSEQGRNNWLKVDQNQVDGMQGNYANVYMGGSGNIGNIRQWGQNEAHATTALESVDNEFEIIQTGKSFNKATTWQAGDWNHARIHQGNGDAINDANTWDNDATIVQIGYDNAAGIWQNGGSGNLAHIHQQGEHNRANIDQVGSQNWAVIEQYGVGHVASIAQHGNGQVAHIKQF